MYENGQLPSLGELIIKKEEGHIGHTVYRISSSALTLADTYTPNHPLTQHSCWRSPEHWFKNRFA